MPCHQKQDVLQGCNCVALDLPTGKHCTSTEVAKKECKILLSNSCLVLPAVVKQQQKDISRNHVPSLFAVSVLQYFTLPGGFHTRRNFRWCLGLLGDTMTPMMMCQGDLPEVLVAWEVFCRSPTCYSICSPTRVLVNACYIWWWRCFQ